MAKIKIKDFAAKYNLKPTQVYELLRHHKHLKSKVKGLGTLVDTTKYDKMTA